MNGQYIQIDVTDMRKFNEKLRKAANGELKKEFATFLDGTGFEMLRVIEEEIIRLKAVDTRLLLNSFHKGSSDNVYELDEGNLTLEIGTNVKYAKWVNDGHYANPQGVEKRFVPGVWTGDGKFRYQPGAKTGMVLKQQFVQGKHYMEHSIKIMEKIFPKLVEAKVAEWIEHYFANL